MERFIVKYSNGKIRQQRGINGTFYMMVGLGVVNYIIDTQEGTIYLRPNENDESVEIVKISTYNSSDLVCNEENLNKVKSNP